MTHQKITREKTVKDFGDQFFRHDSLGDYWASDSMFRDHFGDIFDKVKNRFSTIDQVKNIKKIEDKKQLYALFECFDICELIDKSDNYYLLFLSVRNRDNPRELIQSYVDANKFNHAYIGVSSADQEEKAYQIAESLTIPVTIVSEFMFKTPVTN